MSDTDDAAHAPVLLGEAVQALAIKPGGKYVDATFGRGGHSRQLLNFLGEDGGLLAIDRDPAAVAEARERFGGDSRFHVCQGLFSAMADLVREAWGPSTEVDGILMDLGVSSPQLDDPSRGFSFMRDGPLDMRMDPDSGMSAADWLARAKEQDIAKVLKEYGEERFARRIARAIVAAREEAPVATTSRLAEIVAAACPTREPGKHPATRTFQALRIRVNRELEILGDALRVAMDILAPGGRLVVISFHSLEDRIVKQFMRGEATGGELPRRLPVTDAQVPRRLRLVGKAIRPGAAEVAANPRSRSAVMRVAEKVA